ncbi:VCBS repeat-containing protein [Marinoscillum sp.]|uniref:VCBS repeat-containing protein n=1 Tax=Marinoscillum sp. TaxID=2024838 RepID=UPI003BADA19D
MRRINLKTFNTYLLVAFSLSVLIACKEESAFKSLPMDLTHVNFNNEIIENDSFNILDFEYVYNGGGVALADFNNDGLSDVFFTGNMVPNRLYLNQGGMTFRDITVKAGVGAPDKWSSGVAVVDVNADGWMDIYVCATVYSAPQKRKNMLFINQGLQGGLPVFEDQAAAYGLDDDSHTTVAAFFDYDKDGDLDVYLAINKMDPVMTPNVYKKSHTEALDRVDKLFRNDWDDSLSHPVFTEVSKEAGIIYEGYSLGVNVSDINGDGWSDIYVTNDYLTQDLIYINNQDGTFTNRSKDFLAHTSYSAMGNDVVDINNDGYPDIVAVDMLPEDNFRKKTMMMNNNYTGYINNEKYDYQYQCVRNTLQLNQGFNPVTGEPTFGDMALLAGVSSTDWSWAPMVADFDNDGLRDLIITNGFPKDITDRDFSDYNVEVGRYAKKSMLLAKIPSVKIRNYAYRNVNGVQFEDVTTAWGIKEPSFSNGAAYGDLDNDGDLDYVVNNINDPASIFENLSNQKKENPNNWIRIRLVGRGRNPGGIGAQLKIYHGGNTLYWDHSPYRGYLSSNDPTLVFGLGQSARVDSVVVYWPTGEVEVRSDVPVNEHITLSIENATERQPVSEAKSVLHFEALSEEVVAGYIHEEDEFIDFNVQPLLPHKLSQYGPGMAVGDVNGDGLDDVYISGSRFKKGTFMIQQPEGSFAREDLLPQIDEKTKGEELGALLFDADADGDLDLYLVHGSYELAPEDSSYQDRFYENQDGQFVLNKEALPPFLASGSCVRAADYDQDGDLDLFVGGRQVPLHYPLPPSSYFLRNESGKGQVEFIIDEEASGLLEDFGMVTDALWTDFNNDGSTDLILAGEWMSINFLQNTNGTFRNVTATSGVDENVGWWNSLSAGDFDGDGDVDYLAGNLGLNTINRASTETPIGIYASDFDRNEGLDAVPTVFLPDEQGRLKEFPFFGRGDMIKQMTKIKADFRMHADFARAGITDIFSAEQLSGATAYHANYMESAYIENLGGGRFAMTPLPLECQVAPVYGMISGDYNSDGNLDVLMVGNDYGNEVLQGRYDAFKGLLMLGAGDGTFLPVGMEQSGVYVPEDAKSLTYVTGSEGGMTIFAAQNMGPLKAFSVNTGGQRVISLEPADARVEYLDASGRMRLQEVYYGHTYLSQGSRKVLIPADASQVRVTTFSGDQRGM